MSVEAQEVLSRVIRPVHAGLMAEFGVPNPREAEAMSIAAGFQESKFRARDQGDPAIIGPATGYWQFELNGGVAEILEAAQTREIAAALCGRVGISPSRDAVWRLFATPQGDELACAFARLLVWKDRAALPPATIEGQATAYAYYDRNWRPGKKRPNDWPTAWAVALRVTGDTAQAPAPPPVPAPPADDLRARVEALEAWRARVVA